MFKEHSQEQKIIKLRPIQLKEEVQPEENKSEIWQQHEAIAKKELEHARKEKEKMLTDAREAIDAEKEKWQTERAHYVEQARIEGFSKGFAEGEEEGASQYQAAINNINMLIDQVRAEYDATIEKSEQAILELAIHAAEKIMKQTLSEDPGAFLHIVKAAIKELKDQSVISIHLHPENYQHVVEQKDELERILEHETRLSIYIKQEIARGGCVIEHPFGKIDAGIDTQLEEIRTVLHDISNGELL